MWREYFGDFATIYGVDVQPACKIYENESIKIVIGDQGDREFWTTFKQAAPRLDVVIDDGSHVASDQIISLEELLPHLAPGGVYICEDVFRADNEFTKFVFEGASSLNDYFQTDRSTDDIQIFHASRWQTAIESVALYPFMAVVTNAASVAELVCAKHGTEWQPFLDRDYRP